MFFFRTFTPNTCLRVIINLTLSRGTQSKHIFQNVAFHITICYWKFIIYSYHLWFFFPSDWNSFSLISPAPSLFFSSSCSPCFPPSLSPPFLLFFLLPLFLSPSPLSPTISLLFYVSTCIFNSFSLLFFISLFFIHMYSPMLIFLGI